MRASSPATAGAAPATSSRRSSALATPNARARRTPRARSERCATSRRRYRPARSVAMSGPLIVVVGPTAAGKSALALEIAPTVGAEIVAADSRQVYRGMDVGTAKPTTSERARVPHHLLDLVDPDEAYDVSRYQRDGEAALADLVARSRRAIVVGGTGLYVRALVDGLALAALPHDPAVRTELEAEAARDGPEALHARLASLDPDAAARVHPRNVRRVVRYLEVTLVAGPVSRRWTRAPAREARFLGLLPPRDELDRRIDARVLGMVERGVLAET